MAGVLGCRRDPMAELDHPAATLPPAPGRDGPAEQLLRQVIESAPGALAVFDREMRYLGASRRYREDYRLGDAPLAGRSHYDLFPDLPERWLAVHRRCLAGAVERCDDDPFPRADGSIDWVRWEMRPWRLPDGTVGGLILSSEVVTAQRLLESALREGEARARLRAGELEETLARLEQVQEAHRLALEVLERGEGLYVLDGQFRFVMVNAEQERISGRPRSETLGRVLWDAFPGAADPSRRFWAVYHQVMADRVPARFEEYYAPLDAWHAISAFPTRQGGIAVFFRDITGIKRAEAALRDQDRQRGEFLAVLSHELRNPLAPIRAALDLLERAHDDPARALRAREVLRRQADQLTRLVDDLLDLTRIEHGKVQLRPERLDLRTLVGRAVEDHRPVYEARGVALRLEAGGGPLLVDGDPARLAQVVANLLHNAVRFTPPGGAVSVSVEARGGQAVLLVRDDGRGMAPGDVERMFEPFAQGAPDPGGGLGLGLALVRRLAGLHGGGAEARSAGPGRGSEFTVTLPLAPQPGPAPAAANARPAPPVPRPRTVVIIDDNADAAETLAELLRLDGHRVEVALDGRSGLELARRLRPELVLCDLGLPDVDGCEVARALRADPALRSLRLVAVSGYAQPEDLARTGAAGFDAHLAKPVPTEALAELLAG